MPSRLRLVGPLLLCAALGCLCGAALPRPARAALAESAPAVASYTLRARYDPVAHVIRGEGEILWQNAAAEPVGDLYFHLYLNAFRSESSAFFRDTRFDEARGDEGGRGEGRGARPRREGEFGAIDITSLRAEGDYDLLPSFRFERPDPEAPGDRTVASVRLPALVPPGGAARLRIAWTSTLPKLFRRTGWEKDFVFAAQWFPKLGVFEARGTRGAERSGWNAHPFHAFTEFYADYGNYDVTITVPQGWVVGASGVAHGTEERARADSAVAAGAGEGATETHRFVARSVHDFAWTASPRLVRRTDRFLPEEWRDPKLDDALRRAGVSPEDAALGEVDIVLLLPPEVQDQAPRFFRAACEAIRGYGTLLGRYPYPNLTILSPPHGAEECGGMEYPTLITTGTDWWAPKERLSPEGVTVHEFGHQFFYGVIGTNEFEEPWLDEGLNTWMTARVLQRAYGDDRHVSRVAGAPLRRMPLAELPGRPRSRRETPFLDELRSLLLLRRAGVRSSPILDYLRDQAYFTWAPDVRIPNLLSRRRRFLEDPDADPLARYGFRTIGRSGYRINAYDKPALLMGAFENLFGEDATLRTFRIWGSRHRFGHPGAADFVAAAEEGVGRPIGWFFEPFLREAGRVNYAVGRVRTREAKPPAGIGDAAGAPTLGVKERDAEWRKTPARERAWESEVVVRRIGSAAWPVEVRVDFEGGTSETRVWDGADRWVRWVFPRKVVQVIVDPERRLVVETDWTDNAWREEPDPRPALRLWERLLRFTEQVAHSSGRIG